MKERNFVDESFANFSLEKKVGPFLKWAGGKRWFVESHFDLLDEDFDRLIEPFLGGAAVFFALSPDRALLSDANSDLINCYKAIRGSWVEVKEILRKHQAAHSADYYYKIRAMRCRTEVTKAARFIYLNRTCWNGLYRVNLKGEFNVPIGTKTNVLMPQDDFEAVAKILSGAELRSCDFQETVEEAKSGDFVFVDPPYTINHNENGFIKYNEKIFSWRDQIRLRDCVVAAKRRGARVLVTNANHKSIRDLYRGVGEIISLKRASVISGAVHGRGEFEEVAIKCY